MRGKHCLRADARVRGPQLVEHRRIEDHRVAVAIAVDGPGDRRAGRSPRAQHRRHGIGPHQRNIHERHEHGFELRIGDGVEARNERRQLSLLPAAMLDQANPAIGRRHRRPHGVDVGAGHHGDVDRPAADQARG